MPKQYPQEFKSQVLSAYQSGMPVDNVCQEYRILQATLYRWIKECKSTGGKDPQNSTNYSTVERQKNRLEHILQIVRLSNIIDDVTLQNRLEILANLHEQYEQFNVHELCEALNVSRGTFYNHIFRKADRSKYLKEQQELMLQVQGIFNDSKQRFGAEKIRVVLSENNIRVSKRRIRNIMNELGLVSIRENAKKGYQKRQEYQRRNYLKQNFSAERSNEIWVSDITYFKIKDYAIYLSIYALSLTCFPDELWGTRFLANVVLIL